MAAARSKGLFPPEAAWSRAKASGSRVAWAPEARRRGPHQVKGPHLHPLPQAPDRLQEVGLQRALQGPPGRGLPREEAEAPLLEGEDGEEGLRPLHSPIGGVHGAAPLQIDLPALHPERPRLPPLGEELEEVYGA